MIPRIRYTPNRVTIDQPLWNTKLEVAVKEMVAEHPLLAKEILYSTTKGIAELGQYKDDEKARQISSEYVRGLQVVGITLDEERFTKDNEAMRRK